MAITNIYFIIPVGLFNTHKASVVEKFLKRINNNGTHGVIKLPEDVETPPPPMSSMQQFNYTEMSSELDDPQWRTPDIVIP